MNERFLDTSEILPSAGFQNRLVEAVQNGSFGELKNILIELNRQLGLSASADFQFGNPNNPGLDFKLQELQKAYERNYGSVSIYLGDGSSRLAISINVVGEGVQIYPQQHHCTQQVLERWEMIK